VHNNKSAKNKPFAGTTGNSTELLEPPSVIENSAAFPATTTFSTRASNGAAAPLAPLGISLAPKAAVSARSNLLGSSPVFKPKPTFILNSTQAAQDINAKYSQFGSASSFLGTPLDNHVQASPDGEGFYIHYQGGSIYWTPSAGAFSVRGAIRDKWASLGWERSFLGYPLTDETGTPDGVGRYNHFQGGSVYWTPGTGAREVHGAIRDKWASLGWERSFLGYPLTDETGTPDGVGRYNHFQGGSIYWTSNTAAYEVHGAIRDKWAEMGWELSYLGYPISDEAGMANNGRISKFQHGNISWTPTNGPLVTPATLQFHDTLTSGLSLGGWFDIVMNSAGDFTFSGHLHDSGGLNIDYTLSVILMAPSGTGIAFQRSGHTEGSIAIFLFRSPHSADDFAKPDFNQRISDHWDQLTQVSLFWRLDATDTLTEGIRDILSDLAAQALKALGSAASQALVALIFA
jgi:uncharacterized protein with LGFP repeats